MKIQAPRILIAAITSLALFGLAAPPANAADATSISFTSPTTAQMGVYNTLSVAIGSSGNRAVGGVQFFSTAGQLIGTASTTPSGANGATASIPWVPTQQTTYAFNATFLPSDPTLAGSSTGAPISILATPNGQTVSIAAQQMYKGVPTTLTATVFPSSLTGSVAFSANYNVDGISPSLPLVNGSASYTFTPGSTGWQQFIVSFTSTTNPVVQGAVSQWVNVLLPLGADDISLNPQPVTMANGTTIQLNATTVGGGSPALSAAGGCTLNGAFLTANAGNGLCTVTGVTAASGAYVGATENWPIALVPGTQTATVVAPKSGNVKVGRSLALASTSARTNTGKRISWAVVVGASRCSLSTSNGQVRVTFHRAGSCRVRGSAAAVTGEWKAFRVDRAYVAR